MMKPQGYSNTNSSMNCDCNNSISCEVNNCHYYSNHTCTASHIKVGPQFAASSADTSCSTFRPK